MHGFTSFIEEKLAPPLLYFSQLKYVRIIQRTFISFTGLLITGSMFLLLASLPFQPYKDLVGKTALGIIGKSAGVATGVIALLVVIAASYATTHFYNDSNEEKNDVLSPILISLASYLLLIPATVVKTVIENSDKTGTFSGMALDFIGAKGVFAALIVGIATTEAYRYFVRKNLVIKMPEGVPPMVSQAFAALIPTMIIVTFWWLIRFVFNIDLPTLIMNAFAPLVRAGDTPAAVLSATFLNRLLWSAGIHGGTVVGAVASPIWMDMNVANQTAAVAGEPLKYLFSGVFYDNYIWTGLAPLSVLLCFSKSKRLKTLGLIALPAALFNIGEPLMFGLPIVLNPILMIPFIISSIIVAILAIIAVSTGLIPVPFQFIPWITPAPIKAWMSTNGSFSAVLFVLLTWVITAIIYYVFIKIIEKQDLEEEKVGA